MAKQVVKSVQKKLPKHSTGMQPGIIDNNQIPKNHQSSVNFTFIQKLCLFLFVASFSLYLNTLNNGYVMDDTMLIKNNTLITQGVQSIGALFTTPRLHGTLHFDNDLYRPLSLVMFAVEYQFFGLNPTPGHFINILIYASSVVLLFLFLNKLFEEKKTGLAFIAALLFAVHPIHTEVVANIKSRDELMCFFFAFIAGNLFIHYMKKGTWRYLITGSLAFFLSLLSKETAITFIAVIALTFFFYINENKLRAIIIFASSVIVVVAFLLLRYHVLTTHHANANNFVNFIDNFLAGAPNLSAKLATAIFILGNYLKLAFIPYPLLCDHSYNTIPFVGFGNVWVLVTIIVYISLAGFAIWKLIKADKNPWSFGILFYLITISLFSNILILIGSGMAERFLFFPSLGICIFMAAIIDRWLIEKHADVVKNESWLKNKKIWIALLPVLLIYSCITYSRNEDWQSDMSLYKADLHKAPENTRLNYFYGSQLLKANHDETDQVIKDQLLAECKIYFKKSLAIYPDNTDAHFELGIAYSLTDNNDSAIREYNKTLQIDPKQFNAAANLAGVYMKNKQLDSAQKYYRLSITYDSKNAIVSYNLAGCYMQMEKYDSAIVIYKKTLAIIKENDEYRDVKLKTLSSLGQAYYFDDKFQDALNIFFAEIQADPQSYHDFPFMALCYHELGQKDLAEKYEEMAKQYFKDFKLPVK